MDVLQIEVDPKATEQPAAKRPIPGSYDAYRAVRVYGSLDGLRALSIIAVVWHHTPDQNGWVLAAVPAAKFGFLGVDLFFVLSGFLIVTLLLRERDKNGQASLRNFYMRRALRIFPLYYGLIALFALWFATRSDERAVLFRADLPYLLTYLTNWVAASGMFSSTWSLAAEEQFYLLWPPIERFARRYALMLLLLAIGVSQLIHLGAIDPLLQSLFGWPPGEPRMLRETTFTPICLGVLLAHALHHRPTFERLARVCAQAWAAPVALALLVAVPQFCPDDLRGWPRLSIHVLMTLVLCSAVMREDHALWRLYTFRPLVRIGMLSYGVYLLHHIGIAIAEKGLPRLGWEFPCSHFLIGGAISYALAEFSYRFYESPFLRLKRKFAHE